MALGVAAIATVGATAQDAKDAKAACDALRSQSIAAAAIGLPTKGAEIGSAELVPAAAADNPNGEFCKVLGAIKPMDATAPDIRFEVNLPTNWNGRALQIGGGGYDGQLITGLLNIRFFKPGTDTPLRRGYVTFGSDSGHQARASVDGSFALNDEALANFAGAQLKKTHDVALALISARYGKAPTRMYFHGNSQGGHEGLIVVQRWPKDYDGVVAIHPVYDFIALQLDGNALAKAVYNPKGAWLNPDKLKLLQTAVMKACDKLDGAEDGIVSNVAGCDAVFQIAALRCPGGKDTGDTCLSDPQIKAVKAIDSRVSFGFALAGGVSSFARWPILQGADWSSIFTFGTRPQPANPPEPMKDFGLAVLADPMVRFMVVRQADTDTLKFDPMKYRERLQALSKLVDASDADISGFKARGGKLILMHGTVDSAVSPYNTIDYYQRLNKKFGSSLGDFVRFYVAPGFGHGTGQFLVGWDSLSLLEKWVENGEAPGPQIVVDTKEGNGARTRPLCLYPQWPRHNAGPIEAAASFACVK